MAGASACRSVIFPDPWSAKARINPSTVPGTPLPAREKRDIPGTTFPLSFKNKSRWAAAGAFSR